MRKVCVLAILGLVLLGMFASASQAQKSSEKEFRPALLVIDVQNEYLPYMDDEDKEFALMVINAVISLFREHELPVVRVYHTEPGYGPEPGAEGFEFPASVSIEESDPKVVKNYPSAFTKTDLEKMLRDRECNTLFLCGLSAVGCVLATYHGAIDRDFDVFMVKNGLMSHNASYTDFVEEICETVSYKTLTVMLR
ncbi:MAG: cysteine hydrolase [Candidatus Eiseniibacteriota bacterium]|nr:MAG: cysteine hydrolase [Candidatus Eisenbacteria bacterium]